MTGTESKPELWAVVELFGHARIAGRVSEQTFGGASLVRVDVPEIVVTGHRYDEGERIATCRVIEAHTRSFGAGAIYSVNWCDEATARIAAQSIEHEPLSPYSVRNVLEQLSPSDRTRLLAHAGGESDGNDDPPY